MTGTGSACGTPIPCAQPAELLMGPLVRTGATERNESGGASGESVESGGSGRVSGELDDEFLIVVICDVEGFERQGARARRGVAMPVTLVRRADSGRACHSA